VCQINPSAAELCPMKLRYKTPDFIRQNPKRASRVSLRQALRQALHQAFTRSLPLYDITPKSAPNQALHYSTPITYVWPLPSLG
jgi:hypothetical protein